MNLQTQTQKRNQSRFNMLQLKKTSLFLFFCFLSINFLISQEVDPSPIPFVNPTNPCPNVAIESTAIIKSRQGEIVYLRFAEAIPRYYVIVTDDGIEADAEPCEQGERELVIHSKIENQSLSLIAKNSCGEPEIITEINKRNVHEIGAKQITVSPHLNSLLERWTYQDETPLLAFLNDDESVSVYEKLAFYQEYALGDFPISENGRFEYEGNPTDIHSNPDDPIDPCDTPTLPTGPPVTPVTPIGGNDECNCEVLTIDPNHLKGNPMGWETGDGYFNMRWEYDEGISTDGKQNIPGQSNASWWSVEKMLGASSWVQLVTEGWKSKPNQFKEYDYGNGEEGGSGLSQGYIAIQLLCRDANELPEECNCEKKGTVSYYYESTAIADSHIKDSNGSRQAKASVQNQAMAFYYENEEIGANINGFVPVVGIDNGAVSECEANVNPDFFDSVGNLASSAINVFTGSAGQLGSWNISTTYCYDTTGQRVILADTIWAPDSSYYDIIAEQIIYDIDTIPKVDSTWTFTGPTNQGAAYTQLVSNIIGVIRTPLHIYEDCSSAINSDNFNIAADFTLRPNKTLNFIVISSYKLNSGGKRSWSGEAILDSKYSITVHVTPGQTDEMHSGCCVPHVGAYLVAPGFWENNPTNNSIAREAWIGLHTTSAFGYSNTNGIGYNSTTGNQYLIGNAGFVTRPPDTGACEDVEIKSPWHPRLSNQAEYDTIRGFASEKIHVYNMLGRRVLSLPFNPNLSKLQVEYLVRESLSGVSTNKFLFINYTNKNGINENIKFINF